MQPNQILVGRTFLDGEGAQRRVWAIICGRVYFYARPTQDAPWMFERNIAAPSIEEFAQLIPEDDWHDPPRPLAH